LASKAILGEVQDDKVLNSEVTPPQRAFTLHQVAPASAELILDRFFKTSGTAPCSIGATFNSRALWTVWNSLCKEASTNLRLSNLIIDLNGKPSHDLREVFLKTEKSGAVSATFFGPKVALTRTLGKNSFLNSNRIVFTRYQEEEFQAQLTFRSIRDAGHFVQSHLIAPIAAHITMEEDPSKARA
jgi:hypothetical protein